MDLLADPINKVISMKTKRSKLLVLNPLISSLMIIAHYYLVYYNEIVENGLLAFIVFIAIVTIAMTSAFWIKRNVKT